MFEKETEKRRFETMKKSIYTQYCEQKLPHDFQKRAEGFASMSDTVQEEMFRAGFYCGLNINDVFFDPDRPALDNGNLWRSKMLIAAYGRKKEVYLGELSERIAHLDFDEENEIYFSGIKFLYKKKAKDFHYEILEKIQMSKEEFYENVKSFTEIF